MKGKIRHRDFTLTPLVQPREFSDLLTEVLRSGAWRLLAQSVEAEVCIFTNAHAYERLDDGRARIEHHGHLAERSRGGPRGHCAVDPPYPQLHGVSRRYRQNC
jgi:hypothetical protein